MPTPTKEQWRQFFEFLAPIKEAWDNGVKANLAFWLGIWYGEKARERATKGADEGVVFAFELGVQLKPVWKEIDGKLRQALIAAAVSAILTALGLKK